MKATVLFAVLTSAALLCPTTPVNAQLLPVRAVAITAPANNATFVAPANIVVEATVAGSTFSLPCIGVQFYANGVSVAHGTPIPPGYVYTGTWQALSPGSFQLTAVALYKAPDDNVIIRVTSAPVTVLVLSGQPPKTNLPPIVRITSPANRATFYAPVTIPIHAYAADPNDSISNVEFFAGSTNLGLGAPLYVRPLVTNLTGGLPPPTCYWLKLWTNVPPGAYVLTAIATDSRGALGTSAPVNIAVLPVPTPPPTNAVPLVSVVATGPIAIEGTNCFS